MIMINFINSFFFFSSFLFLTEPTTEWQQCYDENTQHCYYWNINTNEVTWEIPAEFTQYLLLYREYEEKITKLMKEGKTKPKKKKTHKKR